MNCANAKDVPAKALEFLILCASRTGEVLGAKWDEVDLATALWTIPAKRMKADKEHRVPLSDRAVAIGKEMLAIKRSEFVFPGMKRGKTLGSMTFLVLLRSMGRDDTTVHGFRSSFRDWAAEATNFQREVIELALAHVVGGATEQAYQRGDLLDKRRTLMDAWAGYCTRAATGKVIALPITATS